LETTWSAIPVGQSINQLRPETKEEKRAATFLPKTMRAGAIDFFGTKARAATAIFRATGKYFLWGDPRDWGLGESFLVLGTRMMKTERRS